MFHGQDSGEAKDRKDFLGCHKLRIQRYGQPRLLPEQLHLIRNLRISDTGNGMLRPYLFGNDRA